MRNATHILTAAMGVFMGLGGIEHGIGEILQGDTIPSGMVIQSWPESAFFHIVSGEPAMTIIPNLFITGILAILFSLAFLVWAALFVRRKNGGLVLILLSIAMLLVGGGFGPPLIGMIIGAAATRINAPVTGLRTHLPIGVRAALVKIWPGSFIFCIIAWFLLFPGLSILAYFSGFDNPNIIPLLFFCALGLLLMTIFAGFVNDSSRLQLSSTPM